jgi:hypothetical protein
MSASAVIGAARWPHPGWSALIHLGCRPVLDDEQQGWELAFIGLEPEG